MQFGLGWLKAVERTENKRPVGSDAPRELRSPLGSGRMPQSIIKRTDNKLS